MSAIFEELSTALQSGKSKVVQELVNKALADGVAATDILNKGLMPGMDIIAVKFKNNEVYVPEVLLSARAMNAGTALLKTALADSGAKPLGKIVLGTVKGDLHDIGKNLVRMMFEGKGFEVVDVGIDVPPDKFVEACKTEKPDLLAMSALLTTTMAEMKNTVDAVVAAGIRDSLKIIVGGAPITEEFCKSIGADLYAPDGATAAEVAKNSLK